MSLRPSSLSFVILPEDLQAKLREQMPIHPATGDQMQVDHFLAMVLEILHENASHPTLQRWFFSDEAARTWWNAHHSR